MTFMMALVTILARAGSGSASEISFEARCPCAIAEESLGVHLVDVPLRGGTLIWNRDVLVIAARIVLDHLSVLDLHG